MIWILALLAVTVGSFLPFQAGVNASLKFALNSAALAAVGNFTVGGSLVVAYLLVSRPALPTVSQLAHIPAWCWLGGAMGASLVFAGILLSHRLGAATFTACIILGQLTASVVVDHFGWVGYTQHAVSGPRIVGLLMLLGGAFLVRQY